jgi:uncharacterized protein (TIGR03545 family)
MRKKGVIGLAVISTLVIVVSMVFLDKWVEKGMESLSARLIGAQVDFEKVDVSIVAGRIGWERLQVADPDDTWSNLFETGPCGFQIALEPLFSKKFIVKTISVHELQFSTRRQSDGSLRKKKSARRGKPPDVLVKVIENLEYEAQQIPVFRAEEIAHGLDIDALLAEAPLKAPGRIASLQSEALSVYDAWDDRFSTLRNAGRITEIRESVSSIDVDRIDTVEETLSTLAVLNENHAQLKEFQQEVERIMSEFRKDSSLLRENRESVDRWVQEDVQNILERLKLPSFRAGNIGKMLFGERIVERVEKALRILGIVAKVRQRGVKRFPEKKRAVRLAGQDIHFFERSRLPDFWIQRAELTGVTKGGIDFYGELHDLASHPAIIEKPLTVDAAGKGEENASLEFSGIIESKDGGSRGNFSGEMENFPTGQFDFSRSAFFPYRIENGTGTLKANLEYSEEMFLTDVSYSARNVSFVPKDEETLNVNFSEELMKSFSDTMETFSLEARISFIDEEFDFTLRSNLDDLVRKAAQSLLDEGSQNVRARIEERVREETAVPIQTLDSVMNENEEKARSEIKSLENRLDSLLHDIDMKRDELQAKLLEREVEKKRIGGEVFKQFEHYLDKPEREEGN